MLDREYEYPLSTDEKTQECEKNCGKPQISKVSMHGGDDG